MTSKNICSSGSRTLQVQKALKIHSLNDLVNGELTNALSDSKANINRSRNTLTQEGLVQKVVNGHIVLSYQILKIAIAHSNEVTQAQIRICELNQQLLAASRLGRGMGRTKNIYNEFKMDADLSRCIDSCLQTMTQHGLNIMPNPEDNQFNKSIQILSREPVDARTPLRNEMNSIAFETESCIRHQQFFLDSSPMNLD